MSKPIGGRGIKNPYESTHVRVPIPIKPAVEKLIDQWRSAGCSTSQTPLLSGDDQLCCWDSISDADLSSIFQHGGLLPDALGSEHDQPSIFPGVYAVTLDSLAGASTIPLLANAVYIGCSVTSLRQRWRNHHKMPCFEVLLRTKVPLYYYEYPMPKGICEPSTVKAFEDYLIERFAPPLNNWSPGKIS